MVDENRPDPWPQAPVMSRLRATGYADSGGHHAGTFPTETLAAIERLLPSQMSVTAETGCGKSTIFFSNVSREHHVFTYDDRGGEASSVDYYVKCTLTRLDRVVTHFGPTQRTVPSFEHPADYDAVLLDGPHGWPFPELEYYYFYPKIRTGGFLIVDDLAIPTIGRMADVLAEDEMWALRAVAGSNTAIFQRTEAPCFDPLGDGWWTQRFNRRRVSPRREIFLPAADLKDEVSSLNLDRKLSG